MAQKDWEKVRQIIDAQSLGLLEKFLISDQIFLPNNFLPNPFNATHSNFSASDLTKDKPGQWIPVYYLKDIPKYFRGKGSGDNDNSFFTLLKKNEGRILFSRV